MADNQTKVHRKVSGEYGKSEDGHKHVAREVVLNMEGVIFLAVASNVVVLESERYRKVHHGDFKNVHAYTVVYRNADEVRVNVHEDGENNVDGDVVEPVVVHVVLS